MAAKRRGSVMAAMISRGVSPKCNRIAHRTHHRRATCWRKRASQHRNVAPVRVTYRRRIALWPTSSSSRNNNASLITARMVTSRLPRIKHRVCAINITHDKIAFIRLEQRRATYAVPRINSNTRHSFPAGIVVCAYRYLNAHLRS